MQIFCKFFAIFVVFEEIYRFLAIFCLLVESALLSSRWILPLRLRLRLRLRRSRYNSGFPRAIGNVATVVRICSQFPVSPAAPVWRVIGVSRAPVLGRLCGPILSCLTGPSLAATSTPSSGTASAPCPCQSRDFLTTGVVSHGCYLTSDIFVGSFKHSVCQSKDFF